MSKKIFNRVLKLIGLSFVSFFLIFTFVFAGTKKVGESCTVLSGGNNNSECAAPLICRSSTQAVGSSGVCTSLGGSSSGYTSSGQKTPIPTFSDLGGMITNFDKNVVQNSILLLSGVALVVFLAGLVKFIYDRTKGNEQSLKKDKEGMLWSLGALFVLVSLWGIIVYFQDIIGIPKGNTINIPKICVGGNCPDTPSNTPVSDGVGKTSQEKSAFDILNTDKMSGQYSAESIQKWPPQFGRSDTTYAYVAELQGFLNKNGFYVPLDGKYLYDTIEAVKSFQTKNKLAATGSINPSTKAVILYNYAGGIPPSNVAFVKSWNDLSFGSRGQYVTELQTILKNNGCYRPGANDNEDGIFGSATRDAVVNFQNINYLKEDAIVGPSTRAALMSPETFSCN